MKQKVTIKRDVYNIIKAMPVELQGCILRYTLDYLFDPDSEVVAHPDALPFWLAVKTTLDHDLHISKVRSESVRVRWNPNLYIQSTYKVNTKYIQNTSIEQKEGLNEPKKEQIEQKEGVLYIQSNFGGDERKEDKEKKKEKENAPLIPPLKEKEIIKEKEEKKDILVHQSFFEEENTPIKPKKATTSQRMPRPTLEEVQAYILKMGYTFSGEEFFAFYESNGWKVGRNPMKSWQAACRTWQGGRPKTTPVTSGQALPLGLPADEWAIVEKWAKENTTLNLKPEEYLNIRAFCHRKAAVVRAILSAVSKMPNVTDIVQEARILSNRDPYRLKIWED